MSRYHLKQYEKEHMKMAMLKQEETFRQQVRTKQLGSSRINQEPHMHATQHRPKLFPGTLQQINELYALLCPFRFKNCTGCTGSRSY
jgi:hypothetical protein